MPSLRPLLATAAAVLFAGAATASEHSFILNLRGLDLTTTEGTGLAAARLQRALDDYCGPLDMPQPLVTARERSTCREAMNLRGREQIELARARAVDARTVEQASAAPDPRHM